MDEIKFIISQLNKSPFEKNLNIISYDSLNGEQRLGIFFRILQAIDPAINVDELEVADAEDVVVRILEYLRIFKYTPPRDADPSKFRQNLITGEKNTLTDIFHYLLSRRKDLEKRAYLARFLVKIEVSADVEGDQDIVQLYTQYEQLIDEFKMAHANFDALKKSLDSVQELQKDIKAMEEERDQINEKLINVKRKVEENHNPKLFDLVCKYRNEKEQNENMIHQLNQQEQEISELTVRLSKTMEKLKESENNYQMGSNVDEILERLEEEIATKRSLLDDVLPKEKESIKQYVQDMEEIESQPILEAQFLRNIKEKISNINGDINGLLERRMLNNDPMDDKLSLFRQNASLVAKKRQNLEQEYQEASKQLSELERQLDEKRMQFDGCEILSDEELKKYVLQMKNKGNTYKEKRALLAEHRTEVSLLTRTDEILKLKKEKIEKVLTAIEEERGIKGYFTDQEGEENETSVEKVSEDTDQIRASMKKLAIAINEKKSSLAPLIKDLRPLRQQCAERQQQRDEKKLTYNKMASELESNISKLESNVKQMRTKKNELESNLFRVNCEIECLEAIRQIMADEMGVYVSSDLQDKQRSWRKRIEDETIVQQDKTKDLREKIRQLKENNHLDTQHLKQWKDLKQLMIIKDQCIENGNYNQSSILKKDHLIL